MERMPLGIMAYRLATTALAPLAPFLLRRKILRGKEHSERADERLGIASQPRPAGALVWVHRGERRRMPGRAALIETMLASARCNVIVTSGTVTSAKVMSERLPARALHQFVPVDTPAATARFLDYWRPQVGLFVDSDIWPNLVLGAKRSAASVWRWSMPACRSVPSKAGVWRRPRRAPCLAFETCLAQDDEIAARFRTLGAHDVRMIGSLKADAPALPADAEKLEALRQAIGTRPVFLAAQTHSGEEETILPAHDALRRTFADLLTIVVPRHPARGADIAMLCGTRNCRLRSKGHSPDNDTAVYIADTMSELGLFYRLAAFAL